MIRQGQSLQEMATTALAKSGSWWRTNTSAVKLAECALRDIGEQARTDGGADADAADLFLGASRFLQDREQMRRLSAFGNQSAAPSTNLDMLRYGLQTIAAGVPAGCCGLAGVAATVLSSVEHNLSDKDHYVGDRTGAVWSTSVTEILGGQMQARLYNKAALEDPPVASYLAGWVALQDKAAFVDMRYERAIGWLDCRHIQPWETLQAVHDVATSSPVALARKSLKELEDLDRRQQRIEQIPEHNELLWAVSAFVRGTLDVVGMAAARDKSGDVSAVMALREAAQGFLPQGTAADPGVNRFLGRTPCAPQRQLDLATLRAVATLGSKGIAPSAILDSAPDTAFTPLPASSDWRQLVESAEARTATSLRGLRLLAADRARRHIPYSTLAALEVVGHAAVLSPGTRAHLEAAVDEVEKHRSEACHRALAHGVKLEGGSVSLNGIRVERRPS